MNFYSKFESEWKQLLGLRSVIYYLYKTQNVEEWWEERGKGINIF